MTNTSKLNLVHFKMVKVLAIYMEERGVYSAQAHVHVAVASN